MSTWMILELRLLGVAAVSGIFLRACYDPLLIHRQLQRPSRLLVSIEDVLFWLFCCLYTFRTLYYTNNGIVRGFVLIGMLAGSFLYHCLVSVWLVRLLCRFCLWIRKIGKNFVKKLCRKQLKIEET